jgi:hypothetical protein
MGAESNAGVEKFLKELPAHVDVLTINDVISSLDSAVCSYNDNSNGPLTFGPVVVWKVKDAARLRKAIDKLLEQASKDAEKPAAKQDDKSDATSSDDDGDDEKNEDENLEVSLALPLNVTRVQKYGHELITLSGVTTFAIHDQWLVCSVNPQLVEVFLLRADGKLPQWKLTDAHRTALRDLPEKFTSITVDDPQRSLPFWLSLAPTGLSLFDQMVQANVEETDKKAVNAQAFNQADFPPAELIVQPLFPNITVTVSDDKGFHSYSRSSVKSLGWWTVVPAALVAAEFTGLEFLELFDIF